MPFDQDDGWFHIDLPFDFIWFGRTESRITIGTNGVITFGTTQLHNGASEPVPCQWTTGNSGCEGVDYGSTASDPGSAAPDGVIAVFWAVRAPPLNSVSARTKVPWPFDHQDLDASAGVLEQEEGVYYAVIPTTNEDFASWNKLVVTWSIRVFSSNTPVNFQSILFGDGTVLL